MSMSMSDEDALVRTAKRIDAVRDRFVASLAERVDALSDLARQAAGPDRPAAAAAGDSLRLGLHNLSGAAPTLGLVALGRKAGALEARVVAARSMDGRLTKDLATQLADDIAALADRPA